MVYNGKYSGLNTLLWDLHFALPMARSTLPAGEKGTFMSYWNIGDILLDFIISEEVRPFYGVNITNV